ncbi:hypothetical protein ACF09G_13110 [Streptomyces albogriseolus]|uniref:hypothetical protein n=1 Tax=Streptomyces albogriseolus TaxID=1887 RepID=UPI002250FE4F|nr:hypothetical protein [Streptomyces viridodiastaticus]MCX4622793.1 hypothetical protein [Streptomyces viridodiastaticus]
MILGVVANGIKEEVANLKVDDQAPGMIALALSLARAVDSSAKNPAAKAVAARELRAVMKELRAMAPIGEEGDAVDDFARQREKRREEARKRRAG